ncbi:MAG: hypothetical protein SH850_27675, partial [Planctomycetaceae bacterium]|nr:hypothetical protein [Planctomycetaceae bacterium]
MMMRDRSRWCWLVGLVLATSPLPADGPPSLRRVDVPADDVSLWPPQANSMVAIPRDEFERLWNRAQPRAAKPPEATLESARYEASVTGSTLGPGQCVWRVRRHVARPVWLELGGGNIAIEKLRWSDRPAIWGADAAGKLWLWVDSQGGELTGTWSASGQVIADETRFALEFPAALSSTLVLTAPVRRQMLCDDAPLRSTSADDATRTWEVPLGSRATCRLRLTDVVDEPVPKLMTYRRQQRAWIREDHLQFQTTIAPEVLDGEVDELSFTFPAAVEIQSVTWGNDLPLSWTREASGAPRSLVKVKLPDRVGGELRAIRLEGLAPRRTGSPTGIPDVELKDAVFRSGEVLVTVSRPLQVVALRATGCRQQAPVVSTSDGETYNFHQSRPESLLTFEIRSPRSTLAAHVLSAVALGDDEWTQQSEVAWRSTSGTAFQLAMRVPPGWEVIDVDAFSESGAPERISWERLTEADGATRLAVELLDALRPEVPRRFTVWSRRRPVEEGATFECPALRPLDCQSVETVLAFQAGSRYWLAANETGTLKPIDGAQLSAPWNASPMWASLTSGREPVDAWFHSDRSDEAGPLRLDSRPRPVRADVTVRAELAQGVLAEEYTLKIRPEERGASERLLIFITQPGPEVSWRVEQPDGVEVLSRRLTADRRLARELPSGGELWELRLPPLSSEEIVIAGARAQPLSLPARVGLVFLPQSLATTSHAIVDAAESLGLQPSAHRLEDVPTTS